MRMLILDCYAYEEVSEMGKGQEKGKKGKVNKPKLTPKEKKKRKQKKEAA